MQNLNPTRIIARRGRDVLIIGALLLLVGLVVDGCAILVLVFGVSTPLGLGILGLGMLIIPIGFGFMVRGMTYRMENQPALQVADVLSRELDGSYTFIRNVSRRGLGYVDAVLVGPPGALVFRIVDQ